MQRTNIYLEDRQTAALDRLAKAEGVSRAELVRRLIDRGLAGTADDAAADIVWINAAFGAAVEFDVPARAPDAREAHLGRVTSE